MSATKYVFLVTGSYRPSVPEMSPEINAECNASALAFSSALSSSVDCTTMREPLSIILPALLKFLAIA